LVHRKNFAPRRGTRAASGIHPAAGGVVTEILHTAIFQPRMAA
jgi:hypothetical protein